MPSAGFWGTRWSSDATSTSPPPGPAPPTRSPRARTTRQARWASPPGARGRPRPRTFAATGARNARAQCTTAMCLHAADGATPTRKTPCTRQPPPLSPPLPARQRPPFAKAASMWAARHRRPAGEPYLAEIGAGQIVRIVDLEGNQAVDALFYNRHNLAEHYSMAETLLHQGGIYLTSDSVLMSSQGRAMLTIVADTCGRHDTLGGACAAESNTVRYALQKKFMPSCRDNYLLAIADAGIGLGKRDLVPNINFFMNVPVTPQGGLQF